LTLGRSVKVAVAPALTVELSMRADGVVVLRCTRADGSVTWQKQEGRNALFFAFHDLRHFAVEQTFGFRHGFFGLIAAGWEISDTSGKGERGPLPAEAVLVEHIVGLLEHERLGGAHPLSADDLNAQLDAAGVLGDPETSTTLTDEGFGKVRSAIDALHSRFASLAMGESMTLTLDHGEVR
jgi:hypothetical protein